VAAADAAAVCLPAYASEFDKLSKAEKRETIVVAVNCIGGRVPIIAQANYPATIQAARSVREAQQDGASAVCCAVPRMFSLEDTALLSHFDRVLQAIDIPLIIQDFNPRGSFVSPAFVAELHRTHAHLRYVKVEEPLMATKVEAILQQTSGAVGVLEGWGGMFMLELIPSGISGVMSGLGISDILGRALRGELDCAYELFQGVLPQIAFCLQNIELYHHAEKLLLQARGVISPTVVRQATRTLFEQEARHIQFLDANILKLLDHFGACLAIPPKRLELVEVQT
jgi:dihydrodipicolinate synthase/N-acetylneuraminate lyase